MTFVFKHPKYYKELRSRNKLAESRQPVVGGQQPDQAISKSDSKSAGGSDSVRLVQASSSKQQAASFKQQATSVKPGTQASSSKLQALIHKLQASSHNHQAP